MFIRASKRLRWILAILFLPNVVVGADFDLEKGNAALSIVIPAVEKVIFAEVSPHGSDATLVIRVTTLVTNAWFDASAPYHSTAVGVYSRLGRRPAAESKTNANLNTALLYASYRVLSSLLPKQVSVWRDMLTRAGLDPDNNSTDLTTAIGIGNAAGNGVVRGRENDGMNQLGNETGANGIPVFNPAPYLDYTGYTPVNTAYALTDPSRWQPDLQRRGMGLYKIQQFVTPQYALTEPYSYRDPRKLHIPPPRASNHQNFSAYKYQVDGVLNASAELDDERKLKAELFDNKIRALGFPTVFTAVSRKMSLPEFIQFEFLTNMAAHDAGIFVWQEKRLYDAVRPFSAIRYVYGEKPVMAWGGPGKGKTQLPASQWRSYLEVADHPEYPSASTCFCTAHAEAARRFLNSDDLEWQVRIAPGASRIEPGVTPRQFALLEFKTWTQFAEDCGQSRLWAGVHFQAAIEESKQVCGHFGDMAFDYLGTLIAGTAPAREPAKRTRAPGGD